MPLHHYIEYAFIFVAELVLVSLPMLAAGLQRDLAG